MFDPHRNDRFKTRTLTFLVLAISVGLPSVAQANVGTPLVWATMFHMAIGNAFIGLLEGALLAGIYQIPGSRAILLMILANYFSAFFGWTWLSGLLQDRDDLNLYNLWNVIWQLVTVAYLVTLFLEWPFVAACFRCTGRYKFGRTCGATLLVQSVSYLVLFGWYWFTSANSLYTDLSIVLPDQISLPGNVVIYYIADEDGDVYSRDLDSGRTEKVLDLNSNDFADCLALEKSASEKGFHEIVALLKPQYEGDAGMTEIPVRVRDEDCPTIRNDEGNLEQRDRYPSPSRGYAAKLGSAVDSSWTFKAGFWAGQGLIGRNSKTGQRWNVALENPFVEWRVRHATILPTDRVLFQLGKHQLCLFDIESKKIATLCAGRGAIAVLKPELHDE